MSDAISVPEFHDSIEGVLPPNASRHLFGHHEAQARMIKAISSGHHGLLLVGEAGIGKATAAFQLANMLLSGASPGFDGLLPAPNTDEPDWRMIAQNSHPNMVYLTRPMDEKTGKFKQAIPVDAIRDMQKFLSMSASRKAPRVIIIDPVQDLNTNSANALLKSLEEPPENTVFLLIAHGMAGILPTIRSRCQIVRFSPLDDADLRAVLQNSDSDFAQDAATLAGLSSGRVRDALQMALYGGLELKSVLEGLVDGPVFDTAQAHKLADVVAGVKNTIQHQMVLDMVLDLVRSRAAHAAETGNLHLADQLSRFQSELTERLRIANGYNLDKKQEFLLILQDLRDKMAA